VEYSSAAVAAFSSQSAAIEKRKYEILHYKGWSMKMSSFENCLHYISAWHKNFEDLMLKAEKF
jgi:hypothetical protein